MSNHISIVPPPAEDENKQRERPRHRATLDEKGGSRTSGGFSAQAALHMLHSVPLNVMYADLEGTIQYLNEASLRTFRRLEQYLPVRADEIVGKSMDIFHKNPSHQRRMLADPRCLPHEATFSLGPEKLKLLAVAIYDQRGTHVGSMATWDIVTERLAIEAANADYAGQVAAIGRSQAVIEFELDGTIRSANDNFLHALGYSLDELNGRHHSLFVDEQFRASNEYRDFWAKLARGDYVAGEFKRIGKGGKEVWIQASYNPILDVNGRPFKVVKYASDVTAQVRMRASMEQILKGVATNAISLGAASEELSAVSQRMSANAEETAAQANSVSAASEQVSRNVQTVAAGTEEMSASIREIAKNAAEAARVAGAAVSVAAATNTTVAKLGESSAEIGKVIKVITSIAQQTKLLALNATIEAARAGEAGKGFAVVANEVKELAKETAKATEDIGQKIEAIQTDTRGAVTAIGQIGTIINQINDIQSTIASAVEEQTATTNEMSRNVAEGARGTDDIARNITGVARAAQETSAGATKALAAAKALAGMAVELEKLVSEFNALG
jgi:methyl-accepting chemotaxis protein